jgi:hypothetical protein
VGGLRRTPIEKAIAATHGVPLEDRQARYVAKRNKVGLVRVAVWVPTERADELKTAARNMVAAHVGMQPDD